MVTRRIGLLAAVVMAPLAAGVFRPGPGLLRRLCRQMGGNWKDGQPVTINIRKIDPDGTMQGVVAWRDKPDVHGSHCGTVEKRRAC